MGDDCLELVEECDCGLGMRLDESGEGEVIPLGEDEVDGGVEGCVFGLWDEGGVEGVEDLEFEVVDVVCFAVV